MDHLVINNTYSVLVKTNYTSEEGYTLYLMLLGRQFGLVYSDEKSLATQIEFRYKQIMFSIQFYL